MFAGDYVSTINHTSMRDTISPSYDHLRYIRVNGSLNGHTKLLGELLAYARHVNDVPRWMLLYKLAPEESDYRLVAFLRLVFRKNSQEDWVYIFQKAPRGSTLRSIARQKLL